MILVMSDKKTQKIDFTSAGFHFILTIQPLSHLRKEKMKKTFISTTQENKVKLG